jgi:phytanoyl-CoA hydroxylase
VTYHCVGITEHDPAFLALARDPRLVALLVPLIGEDIVLMHSKFVSKPLLVDAGPVVWHQDGAYFPHSNGDVPTLMLLLDDATPMNGGLQMLRGSHRLGYLDHHNDDGWFCGESQRRVWEEQPQNVVAITPRRGGVSIHHPLMLHASPANRSGLPRRGLAFAYRAADAMQLGDMIWSETGLVINGAQRGIVRCDPHPIRLPRFAEEMQRGERGTAWNQVGAFARACNHRQGLSALGETLTGSSS